MSRSTKHRPSFPDWRRLAGAPTSRKQNTPLSTALVNVPPSGSKASPSLNALFWGFSSVGLSGFGGVLPFARRLLVDERQWITAEAFNAQLGLCQFLPGPNVVNLAVIVGKRYQGWLGALVAPLGLLAGPMLIVLLLALLYDRYGALPVAQGLLRGMAAAGCGLLFAMAWRMGMAIPKKPVFWPFTLLTVTAMALLRWPLPLVMIGGLLLSGGVAYWTLGQK